MTFFQWIRSLFAWETVRDTGIHRYQINTVSGARRVLRHPDAPWQPINAHWLRTGEW